MSHLQAAIAADIGLHSQRSSDQEYADETFWHGVRCEGCQFKWTEGDGIHAPTERYCTAREPTDCPAVQDREPVYEPIGTLPGGALI
jgi:hypothetical protein